MTKEELLKIIKEEGDEYDFEAFGLPCYIKRVGENGHLCGYVKVPNDSRLYGKNYYTSSDSELGISKLEQAINDLQAHGGITFAGKIKEGDAWWFGFDCAHSGDLQLYSFDMPFIRETNEIYRTKEYVIEECISLAKQLKEIIDLNI